MFALFSSFLFVCIEVLVQVGPRGVEISNPAFSVHMVVSVSDVSWLGCSNKWLIYCQPHGQKIF